MEIENPENAEIFLRKTQNIFEMDEVKGNLIYGLVNNLLKNKNYYGNDDPFFSIAYDKNEIKFIGLLTLPHKINIFQNGFYDDISMDIFVDNIFEHYKSMPGVSGEKNIAEIFTKKWLKRSNCKILMEKSLKCYKLETINEYYIPIGIFRKAEIKDKNIIKEYTIDFNEEIGEPVIDDENLDDNITENINNGSYYVWENDVIVSIAKKARPTKNGMAVHTVYTPKKYRRKGYGTSIVAELSKNIINSGKTFCTLFTDSENSISNSIYQKVGYKIICENVSYKFL